MAARHFAERGKQPQAKGVTRTAETVLSCGGMAPGVEHSPAPDVLSPADRCEELFVAVQSERVDQRCRAQAAQ
jgi:hypothetical protein